MTFCANINHTLFIDYLFAQKSFGMMYFPNRLNIHNKYKYLNKSQNYKQKKPFYNPINLSTFHYFS